MPHSLRRLRSASDSCVDVWWNSITERIDTYNEGFIKRGLLFKKLLVIKTRYCNLMPKELFLKYPVTYEKNAQEISRPLKAGWVLASRINTTRTQYDLDFTLRITICKDSSKGSHLSTENQVVLISNALLQRLNHWGTRNGEKCIDRKFYVCMYVCMYLMIGKGQIAQKRPYWGENRLKSKIYG